MAVLEGNPADRVPMWLLFPYHPIGCYVDVRTRPGYRPVFEASKERAIMLNRRNLHVPVFSPEVARCHESLTEDGWQITRDHVEWKDIRLFSETRRRDGEVRIKKLIENEDDLLAFCRLPVNTDRAAIRSELEKQMPRYQQEKQEFPMEYGAMMLDLGEPIGTLYSSSNLTEYPIWSVTQNDAVTGLLDRLMERSRAIYDFCLERDLADVYFLVGSELASPPMVSRATFQQWIVPHARELIASIHAAGKKAIQHYHGQIREVLPDFLTMRPDAIHTIEAPPNGNCTFTQAFDIVGSSIALIGNIQYDLFRSSSQPDMRRAVMEVIDECRGKRLILSPSAGPYEEAVSDNVIRNYLEFMNAAWEYGRCP